jgi:hypothetical protein
MVLSCLVALLAPGFARAQSGTHADGSEMLDCYVANGEWLGESGC